MDAEREYVGIQARLDELKQQLLRYEVENEAKQQRVEQLKQELVDAGIDVENLMEEKARIEREMEEIVSEGQQKIQEFSNSLNEFDLEELEELEPIEEEQPTTESSALDDLDLD